MEDELYIKMCLTIRSAILYILDVSIASLLIQVSINILFNINFQIRRYWGIFLGLLGLGLVIGALFNQLFFCMF